MEVVATIALAFIVFLLVVLVVAKGAAPASWCDTDP